MTSTAILGLLAETSIHAGAGQTLGVIDLPIQREAHTDWPVIFGSGVKGAMRTAAENVAHLPANAGKVPAWVDEVFGPPRNDADRNAGALLVGDARLLLLPVRSMTTHFKWVTCPAILDRYRRDCARLRFQSPAFTLPAPLGPMQALVAENEGSLFLEEFRLRGDRADLTPVIDAMARHVDLPDAATALQRQLTIVANDTFRHLARYATPVSPHVAIDNDRKTVRSGALWYEETLPPETVLYVSLIAARSRVKDSTLDADAIMKHVREDLFEDPYLQIAGNETVGMGWCRAKWFSGGK